MHIGIVFYGNYGESWFGTTELSRRISGWYDVRWVINSNGFIGQKFIGLMLGRVKLILML